MWRLPLLTSITGGPVQLESDGVGSTLNINALTTLQGNTGQQYYSGVQATNHGTVSDAALATLKQANLTLDGTGTISLGQIATLTGGTASLSGGTATLSGLTDADGSSFLVSGGGKLTRVGAGELRRADQHHRDVAGHGYWQRAVVGQPGRDHRGHRLVQLADPDRGALGWRRRAGQARDDHRRPGATGKRRSASKLNINALTT